MHPHLANPPAERPEVVVAVLGPVEVVGAARPLRRSRSAELVTYLALHPHGAVTDVWATALWPERVMAPPTLHSTCSAARRALGRGRSGRDHLPHARGRLRLEPTVITDWAQFTRWAEGAGPSDWERALGLVRGRPFESFPHADWPILEGFVAQMEEAVVEVALQLAGHHLGRDGATSARLAAHAARCGLRASPYDERLYRVLLRAADEQGHPGGVESVMGELERLLDPAPGPRASAGPRGASPCALVHPQTAALYRSLSRHVPVEFAAAGRATGSPSRRL